MNQNHLIENLCHEIAMTKTKSMVSALTKLNAGRNAQFVKPNANFEEIIIKKRKAFRYITIFPKFYLHIVIYQILHGR